MNVLPASCKGHWATLTFPFLCTEIYFQHLPYIVLGTLAVLSAIAAYFLPETYGKPLPQNIQDMSKCKRWVMKTHKHFLYGQSMSFHQSARIYSVFKSLLNYKILTALEELTIWSSRHTIKQQTQWPHLELTGIPTFVCSSPFNSIDGNGKRRQTVNQRRQNPWMTHHFPKSLCPNWSLTPYTQCYIVVPVWEIQTLTTCNL